MALMSRIHVCPLSAVEALVGEIRPSRLVTLISEGFEVETPDGVAPDAHLRLIMHDIESPSPGLRLPSQSDVDKLLDFVEAWDGRDPILIHCWAGVSRSTAAAYIVQCALNPDADEHALANRLRAKAPTASPNRRLVELADRRLRRGRRMIDAVEAIGRGNMTLEGQPFSLRAELGK